MRSTMLSALLLSLACGGATQGASTSTTPTAELDAPAPVRAELTRLFGAEAALTLEHEQDEDGEEWEVETATSMELELDAEGAVGKIEFAVPLGLVPAPVVEAARACWPGATFEEAEAVIQGDTLLCELEATGADGEELEGYWHPDGRGAEEPAAAACAERPAPDGAEEPDFEEAGDETSPE